MQLFSYWQGPLGWMERLSVASAVAQGHRVMVFTQDIGSLSGRGLEADILDARDLLNDPSLDRLRQDHPAHYSDHFRLKALAHDCGTWMDLDTVHIRPLPNLPYLMGWEHMGHNGRAPSVNNAILKLPSDSPILADYIAFCAQRPIPLNLPWYPRGQRARRRIKSISHALRGKKMVAPLLGPATLSHLVERHGLTQTVLPEKTFYPIAYNDTCRITEPGFIENAIGPDTLVVHLWHSKFRKLFGTEQPPCDWLDRKLREFDVRVAA